MMPLQLPTSQAEIKEIQRRRKRAAVESARRSPFWGPRLAHIDSRKLDDPSEWRKIPILEKDALRKLSDQQFYSDFCLKPIKDDYIAEYWRSGGVTGTPLFYPRSCTDIQYLLLSFSRVFDCVGCGRGDNAHISFPLGIHPVGQMFARCAPQTGIGVNWAGSGATTPSLLQLELIQRLRPTIWLGMSSYGLHLASLAEAQRIDLAQSGVQTVICSAEPVSDAKRDKLARSWGASMFDTFGMTEAGMMGAEEAPGRGFSIWSDMYFIEVLDPDTYEPVPEGEVGALVVTSLWTNNITPFLRWSSGDLVTYQSSEDVEAVAERPFSVFPRLKHAHRTTGFFKVRGINLGHAEFEDFMFATRFINDFRVELVTAGGLDQLRLSIEVKCDVEHAGIAAQLARATKDRFEITPDVVLLDTGTLAREFEASVKAPRFVDRRQ